jgi:hypothetical protein
VQVLLLHLQIRAPDSCAQALARPVAVCCARLVERASLEAHPPILWFSSTVQALQIGPASTHILYWQVQVALARSVYVATMQYRTGPAG